MHTKKTPQQYLPGPITIFMVGIKGVGMTGLAQILKSQGKTISGSDTTERFFTQETLDKEDILYTEQFQTENISENIDLVIASEAYDESHPEIQEARKKNIPVIYYQDALGELSAQQPTIAIAGSHGKTTTTALTGVLHEAIQNDPTVLVGSQVPAFRGNARIGHGELFICEADEYNKKLLKLHPKTLVITNIDYDHPDTYPTKEDYRDVFQQAIDALPDDATLILNADDTESAKLNLTSLKGAQRTFSTQKETATVYSTNRTSKNYGKTKNQQTEGKEMKEDEDGQKRKGLGTQTFDVFYENEKVLTITTSLLGAHNVANILASLATISKEQCIQYQTEIQEAIQQFQGTKRRLEYIGITKNGTLVLDDYAHHPTEIQATLKALKETYPKKSIWCIFHPHTYTRTEVLFKDFATSFQDADHVFVLDIYSSAREKKGTVSAADLAQEIAKHQSGVMYAPNTTTLAKEISSQTHENDIIITMGAGDVWQIAEQLAQRNE